MNIAYRNIGADNKHRQNIMNDMNNKLSLPNKDRKQIRVLEKVPRERTISFKKNVPYDNDYATKSNTVSRSSYHDDLINSLNIKTKQVDEDTHTLLTSTASHSRDYDGKKIIQTIKPKNQVSGIVDKNLMSHIIVPSSLVSAVTPKNNIKHMDVYRKADTRLLPPVITPVVSIKEKTLIIK